MGDEHGELQRHRNRSGAALDHQHPAGLDAARRHRRAVRMGEDRRLLARGRHLGDLRLIRRLRSSEPARQSGARRRLVGVWPDHEYRRRTLCRQRLGELQHVGVFAGPTARLLCGRRGENVECAADRWAAMPTLWSTGDGAAWLHAALANKGIQQMGMRNTESARIETLRRRALLQALLFMHGSGSAASGVTAGSDVSVAPAPQHRHGGAKPDRDEMWQAMLAKQQTLAVAVQFDAAGRLWRARVQDGHVLVDRSDDGGASFGTAVFVFPVVVLIAADGDARPKLAVAPDGALYVTYTQLLNKLFSGDIRFSRSLDGGNSFSAPVTINGNRDIIGHRFDALAVGGDGKVYIAWLDKRDEAAARQRGESYIGSALYYAASADRGASFGANVKLADHACECCRIALDLTEDGVPVAFWRHVYGDNERDHAVLKLDGKTEPQHDTHKHKHDEACPHHGPALSIDAQNNYHLVWFSDAPAARGLFYARSHDGGKTLSAPIVIGNAAAQAGHADVLSRGRALYVVWKEFDGEASLIRAQQSRDGGISWSAPRTMAATADASDHPELAARGAAVYLSWNTAREGYRLIALSEDERCCGWWLHCLPSPPPARRRQSRSCAAVSRPSSR